MRLSKSARQEILNIGIDCLISIGAIVWSNQWKKRKNSKYYSKIKSKDLLMTSIG